jgi:hypothetical protein
MEGLVRVLEGRRTLKCPHQADTIAMTCQRRLLVPAHALGMALCNFNQQMHRIHDTACKVKASDDGRQRALHLTAGKGIATLLCMARCLR